MNTIIDIEAKIGDVKEEKKKERFLGLVGTKYKTNWFLLLFIFLIPLRNIQLKYFPNFGGGLNFLNIGLLLSIAGMLIVGGTLSKDCSVNKRMLVLILYMIFSLFVGYRTIHGDTSDHFNVLKDTVVAMSLLFVVQKSVRDWVGFRRIFAATLLPLPYMTYVVWNQYSSVAKWHYYDGLRISGTFADLGANELGAFFVTTALVMTALFFVVNKKIWKMILLGSLLLAFVGIMFSYSRAAYLSYAAGALVIFLLYKNKLKMLPYLLIGIITIAAVVPTSVVERFDTITTNTGKMDESEKSRLVFWGIAADYMKQHPIIGLGYYTFHHKQINPFGMDTHNYFVKVMVEQGVIGMLILLSLFFGIYRTARRRYREGEETKNDWQKGFSIAMAAALAGLMVGNMFGDRFSYYPLISYFWIYTGLLLAMGHIEKTSGETEETYRTDIWGDRIE